METIFPTDAGFASFFIIGFRKVGGNITERTGTAILKRTYEIDPLFGSVTPAAEPLPIFMQDTLDNVVVNSRFRGIDNAQPLGWTAADGVVMTVIPDPTDPMGLAQLLNATGAANGRIVQTIAFEEPLGGRTFTFSVRVSADFPTTVQTLQLEADGVAICTISRNLGFVATTFSATATWPADLEATEMQVVLRTAQNAAANVRYATVQVEERDHRTRHDPIAYLRYEHDLVPYKPQADVLVLGFGDVGGLSRLRVNGVTWLEETVSTDAGTLKALFGWEPRTNDEDSSKRQDLTGGFSTNADDYPLQWPFADPIRDPLPGGPGDPRMPPFDNRFYNAYWRDAALAAPFAYLPASAQIDIERAAGDDYQFQLHGEAVSGHYHYYSGNGDDDESQWATQAVAFNLDTLVIEPDRNRCHVVWRGVWNFDAQSEDQYRRLVVTAQ